MTAATEEVAHSPEALADIVPTIEAHEAGFSLRETASLVASAACRTFGVLTSPDRRKASLDLSATTIPQSELDLYGDDEVFIDALLHPYVTEASDGTTRVAWLFPADPARPKREPLIFLNGLTVSARWGLGLEKSSALQNALTNPDRLPYEYEDGEGQTQTYDPNRDLLVIGNLGVDSPPPPLSWYTSGPTFHEEAEAQLEQIADVEAKALADGQVIDLRRFVVGGESMGTIEAAHIATRAPEAGREAKGIIQLAPAGVTRSSLLQLVRGFVIPEAAGLVRNIADTPVDKLPHYMETLAATAIIPPHAAGVLAEQVRMIKNHDYGQLAGPLPNIRQEIHSGEHDFVANAKKVFEVIVARGRTRRVTVHERENHARLARTILMANRMISSLAAIDTQPAAVEPHEAFRTAAHKVSFAELTNHARPIIA